MQIKLLFKSETKKIKKPKDYDSLISYCSKNFTNLPQSFKFFYFDQEGDLITISSQVDLEEALEMPDVDFLKIYIDSSIENVRQLIA
jgi:hypothetical protein